QMATSTPSRASASVMALPMPSLAPVTSSVLPVIPKSIGFPPYRSSDEHTNNRQTGKERADPEHDRSENIDRRVRKLAAFKQQGRLERIGRERRVAAQNARGQKQEPASVQSGFQGEIFGNQAHDQRAGDIDEHGAVGEIGADEARRDHIDAVAKSGAKTAAEKDDKESRNQPCHSSLQSFARWRRRSRQSPTDARRQVGVISRYGG